MAIYESIHCREIHILLTNLTYRSPESSNFLVVSRLIANMSRLSRIIQTHTKHTNSQRDISYFSACMMIISQTNSKPHTKGTTDTLNWMLSTRSTVVLCFTSNSCWKWNIVMHYLCMCCCGYVFVMIKLWRFPQYALEKHFVSRKVEWVSKRFAATASQSPPAAI